MNCPHLLLFTINGNRYFSLEGSNNWKIGREKNNDFVITDLWISYNHALLSVTASGEFYLIDLGSQNGTFVNGYRVGIPVILQSGDRITLGKTKLEFYCPQSHPQDKKPPNRMEDDTSTSILSMRRLMSVMVINIRDFTTLVRQIEDDFLSLIIGSWFKKVDNIIYDSGGWVSNFIGSKVMAIWFHEQQQVAKKELIEIFKAISTLNQMTVELSNQYPLPFSLLLEAGLNTGYAMLGNVGTGNRPNFTPIGDTINLALALESATKEINEDLALGEKTYAYLSEIGNNQDFFQQYRITLSGYDFLANIYAVKFSDLERFWQQEI
jgi:adenylate cyclase